MIESYLDLGRIVLQGLGILLLLLLIYRSHILSVFDPLTIFLVTQAFSIELAFLLLDEVDYLINFLSCQFAFTFGFLLFAGSPVKRTSFNETKLLKPNLHALSLIKLFAVLSFIIIIACNIYLIRATGVGLLADDPSAAKAEVFLDSGGLGIIRRVNWGMLYLCALFCIYLYLFKRSFLYLAFSIVLLLLLLLSGSKGVLLYFIALIPLLYQFKDVRARSEFQFLNGSKYVMLVGGFALAIYIIFSGMKGSLQEAFFGLGSRFLFFGDAMLYYYDKFSVKHFSVYNMGTFLFDEFNGPLGFLRIFPYEKPLGFKMVDYQLMFEGDTIFGPNVPYYVKGHIYFGSVGAVLYSFVVGGIVGMVRNWFYKLLERPVSILKALLIVHLNITIFSFPQDSQLFIGVLFDTLVLSLPIWLFWSVMLFDRKKMCNNL